MRGVVLVAVCLLLAACVSNETAPAAHESSSSPEASGDVSLGTVDGTVLNEEMLPIANASVALVPAADPAGARTATTGATGAFTFQDVPFGSYLVQVSALGYQGLAQKLEVSTEKPAALRIILPDVPSNEPYVVVQIKSDLLGCAPAAIFFSTTGQCGNPSSPGLVYKIEDGWNAFVSETTWSSPQEYVLQQFIAGGANTKNHWSRPVHRAEFWPGMQDTNASLSAVTPFAKVPTEGFELRVYTLYSGQYRDEIQSVAGPACQLYGGGQCSGAGFTLELRFTQHVSVFFNGNPADLNQYTALPPP